MNERSFALSDHHHHHHMAFPPHHGFLFHSHEDNDPLPSPSSLNSLPSCPPQLLPGVGGVGGHYLMKRSMSFSGVDKCEDVVGHGGEDDLSDDGSQLGEKKKRLNLEQVKALEKSFELGNKLEPERKMQLAKALGLQPRQIAIWFQNRRARWKTKQLEKDYDILKKQFDALKSDNDALQAQNKKLHAELLSLKGRDSNEISHKKETYQCSWSNGSENSCDVNLEISRSAPMATSPSTSSQPSTKHLFSTSIRPTTTSSVTHLLQVSSRSSDHLQSMKVDHQLVHQDENFCSMFNVGIDEQQGFWQWQDQQHHAATFSLNQAQFSNN